MEITQNVYCKAQTLYKDKFHFQIQKQRYFVTIREPFCYCCPPLPPLRRYLLLRSVADCPHYLCRSLTAFLVSTQMHSRNPRKMLIASVVMTDESDGI